MTARRADPAPMDRFEPFTAASVMDPARLVYRSLQSSGQPVLVLHEIFGASDAVFDLAARIADKGFTTYVPVLFGRTGPNATALNAAADFIRRPCLFREFAFLAARRSSPIVDWLRRLAWLILEYEKERKPDVRGIGVVGLCLTGSFALTMMLDEWVLAPVVSEPALPAPMPGMCGAMHLSPGEVTAIQTRVAGGAQILAFRFRGDWLLSPAARFRNMRRAFGSGFLSHELTPTKGRSRHSVLTGSYPDEPQGDSEWAFNETVGFLRRNLQ